MTNWYYVDVLTSVDFQEIVKIGGKVIKICKGVISKKIIEISPLSKVIEILLALRENYKGEAKVLLQGLVKLMMSSLYGVQNRKDFNDFSKYKYDY